MFSGKNNNRFIINYLTEINDLPENIEGMSYDPLVKNCHEQHAN